MQTPRRMIWNVIWNLLHIKLSWPISRLRTDEEREAVIKTGWCNLHNAGCIIQVAGHVLWPRAAWLYQEAVTQKKANISMSGGLQMVGM